MKKILLMSTIAVMSTASLAEISHYGFIKGAYLSTDKELSHSDKKPFWVTDKTGASDLQKEGRSQFSFTQSRWGLKAKHDKISGKIEFDLDGENANKNGDASSDLGIIRVRQANMSYKVTDNGTFTFGKKWTKFMGILPHTYSYTKVFFFAGNTGFLIDGADYTHKFGDLSVAFEMSNIPDNATRKVSAPIMTANVDYKNDMFRGGFAYTRASLDQKVLDTTNNKDSDAMGMKLYGALTMVSNLDFRAEYYTGKNLKSIHTGALATASATDAKDYEEKGYFVSAKYKFSTCSVFAGYGSAEFDKASEAGASALSANTLTHFGFDHKLEENLTAFAQYEGFNSTWNQADANSKKDSKGRLIEVGLVYKF